MVRARFRTFKPGLSTGGGGGADSAFTVNAVKQTTTNRTGDSNVEKAQVVRARLSVLRVPSNAVLADADVISLPSVTAEESAPKSCEQALREAEFWREMKRTDGDMSRNSRRAGVPRGQRTDRE
jgi:hypothetical protein